MRPLDILTAVAAAAVALAGCVAIAKAQAPTANISAACIPQAVLPDRLGDMGYAQYRVKPLLIDEDHDAWVLVEDAASAQPNLLLIISERLGLACLVTSGTRSQS